MWKGSGGWRPPACPSLPPGAPGGWAAPGALGLPPWASQVTEIGMPSLRRKQGHRCWTLEPEEGQKLTSW